MRPEELALDDPAQVAAALRRKNRRWAFALLGNALLLAVMVGVPYVRGHLRTRALWREYGAFGACLYGGRASPIPALGTPRGEEAQFAARVLDGDPTWPARCFEALERLSPPEAIFLLPGLKTAELDVRAAVDVLRSELTRVREKPSRAARISTRPLRALAQLRAALARHALAAGVVDLPGTDAFSFARATGLAEPARVPLYAGADAAVSVWGSDAQLSAIGVDRRGISFVSAQAGQITQTRLPRPKLLQAYLPAGDAGVFVWAMPEARCRERATGCANKSMGLARAVFPLSAIPEPRWVAAHPASRIDRALLAHGDAWLIAAQTEDGAVEVREIEIPESAPSDVGSELAPLSARARWHERLAGQPLLLASRGDAFVLVAQASATGAQLFVVTPEKAKLLSTLPVGGDAWVVGTSEDDAARFAFGHGAGLVVGTVRGTSEARTWESVTLATREVVHPLDRAGDRVLRVATSETELALVRDASDELQVVACPLDMQRCSSTRLAENVRAFAALPTRDGVLVAYAGAAELAQVRIRDLDARGVPRGDERVPAPCWSQGGGACGAPRLDRVGSRVLLGAREGTDLLVLESPDDGATWETMKGLRRVE